MAETTPQPNESSEVGVDNEVNVDNEANDDNEVNEAVGEPSADPAGASVISEPATPQTSGE